MNLSPTGVRGSESFTFEMIVYLRIFNKIPVYVQLAQLTIEDVE